jgi:hypothetical protein
MATIDNLISVSITNETQAVSLPSFATPLIMGTTDAGWDDGDVVHSYNGPAGLLSDGFKTDSPEYLAALAMCSGTITPSAFLVGRRTAGDAAEDLAAITAANDTWYCLLLAEPSDEDIVTLATQIEGQKKIFLTSSSTAGIATSANDDLASSLKSKGYSRTGLLYTQNKNAVAEAAWVGGQLPQTPGSNNWAYKKLAGAAADTLAANQLSQLYGTPIAGVPAKNVNAYTLVGGNPITFPGIMAGGQFIDITIGLDWLQANIQTGVYALLSAVSKVPYTDAGAAMLMSVVRGVMAQGEANGLIDGSDAEYPISVTCPPVSSVSRAQRAARIAPTINFACRLQGAFNSVKVVGNVSV